MPLEITIQRFDEGDLADVLELVRNTIDISYRPDYSAEVIAFFKQFHTRQSILDDARNGYIVVASVGGEIAGTGTLLGAYIRRVFISPSHQRRGIGTLIAADLERRAAADGRKVLDLSSALGSRTFWESQGYSVREEHFAPAPNDLIIHYYTMEKILLGGTV
ncbi:MAG: GNAT family N-acetyltransferase [Dehalococcoidales bacterium]|nr:GNAT family N-acetyltransferase [Dehalococcoidales bacterium]